MRKCARCGQLKSLSEFGWKNEAKGWRASYCRPCVRANSRDHYAANPVAYVKRARANSSRSRSQRLQLLLDYFATRPCVDCGETDPLVLDFDHLRDKEFTIGHELYSRRWSDVVAEMAKCDVVCANCHRRREAKRRNFLRLVLSTQA
jgi:hypothetical protein